MLVTLSKTLRGHVSQLSHAEELDVIHAALRFDRAATATLVFALTPVIRARARRAARHTRGLVLAEDFMQETWARLWTDGGRALRRYDPSLGFPLSAYVATIASRVGRGILRAALAQKRGARQTCSLGEAEPVVGTTCGEAQDELRFLVEHLEATLPPRGRDVLQEVFLNGRPPEEVAQELGLQLGATYNWQYKIRQAARHWRLAEA